MEELSDENMHFKYIGNVFTFHISENVCKRIMNHYFSFKTNQ